MRKKSQRKNRQRAGKDDESFVSRMKNKVKKAAIIQLDNVKSKTVDRNLDFGETKEIVPFLPVYRSCKATCGHPQVQVPTESKYYKIFAQRRDICPFSCQNARFGCSVKGRNTSQLRGFCFAIRKKDSDEDIPVYNTLKRYVQDDKKNDEKAIFLQNLFKNLENLRNQDPKILDINQNLISPEYYEIFQSLRSYFKNFIAKVSTKEQKIGKLAMRKANSARSMGKKIEKTRKKKRRCQTRPCTKRRCPRSPCTRRENYV